MTTYTEYRVLSVRQPFADQILTPRPKQPHLPLKWCENRSWHPNLGPGATIHIHASGRHRSKPTGVILGHVTLVGVIQPVPNPTTCRRLVREAFNTAGLKPPSSNWEHAGVNYDSQFWWLLAHPVRLEPPIAAKGQLRLWKF